MVSGSDFRESADCSDLRETALLVRESGNRQHCRISNPKLFTVRCLPFTDTEFFFSNRSFGRGPVT